MKGGKINIAISLKFSNWGLPSCFKKAKLQCMDKSTQINLILFELNAITENELQIAQWVPAYVNEFSIRITLSTQEIIMNF